MPVNWNRRSYSKEQFVEAWTESDSIAEVARKLNLTIYGSTYIGLKEAAKEEGLTREHMTGQGWAKGKFPNQKPKRPIEDVLVYGKPESTSGLKKRLYHEGLKKKACEICNLTEWLGRPAPLALDHIDGDRLNNRLDNLRILCYNCHGMTDTFAGKNVPRVGVEPTL